MYSRDREYRGQYGSSTYSQWTLVNIAVPGIRIYSTLPNDSCGIRSGASCPTTFVNGITTHLFGTLEDGNKDAKLNEEIRITIENNFFDISRLQH